MRFRFGIVLAFLLLAKAQVPLPGPLYGPLRAKEFLPPNLVVLESGHRLLLGGVEFPHWGDGRYLQAQLRRRSLDPKAFAHRASESLLCVGRTEEEVYLELEPVEGQGFLAHLFVRQRESQEYLLDRPLFAYQGFSLDHLGLLWVRTGCAWAAPTGRYAGLLREAEEAARREGRGIWRP
uniref:TNase-like domain-containing protein n=1 Tax=Thermus caliditerrae TaxID=1330700 RepID=A0A7C5REN2_9DEIN